MKEALAVGGAAALYIAPTLTRLALPAAHADSTPLPSCRPNVNLGNEATLAGGVVSGNFTVTLTNGTGSCQVGAVNLYLSEGGARGRRVPSSWVSVVNGSTREDAGAGALPVGTYRCSPCSNQPFRDEISTHESTAKALTVILAFQLVDQGPAHGSSFWFTACVGPG